MRGAQVYVVDDDPSVLRALRRILYIAGYEPQTFSSADEFLNAHDPKAIGCAVFDLAMPDCSGLQLQQRLALSHTDRPIIFLTGHGSVPESVRAMQAGAVDFLLKPINANDLLHAIARAVQRDCEARKSHERNAEIERRVAKLTPREYQVLTQVIAGRLNKQIAADLGTVEKTIKVHRGRMMVKMEVRTIVELVRMTESIGLAPAPSANARN